jgi:uncharacterized protein
MPLAPIIEQHTEELAALCRKHHVAKLALFGSAARGDFRPGESDLDFLVTFQPMELGDYADAYFGLADDLETTFGTRVDLLVESAIRNPIFRECAFASRVPIYAA